jgi:hypothetical protein
MSALIYIGVDITLSTTLWVIKKTTYGIYSGVYYLIYGNLESTESRERRLLLEQLQSNQKLLLEMKQKIDIMEEKNPSHLKEHYDVIEPIETNQSNDTSINSENK